MKSAETFCNLFHHQISNNMKVSYHNFSEIVFEFHKKGKLAGSFEILHGRRLPFQVQKEKTYFPLTGSIMWARNFTTDTGGHLQCKSDGPAGGLCPQFIFIEKLAWLPTVSCTSLLEIHKRLECQTTYIVERLR